MIPVVGLDVAKGATEGQAFLDKGRPYGPHFQITHTAEGLEQLQVLLNDLAAQTHCPPTVILESTGHYHVPVVRLLEDHGYAYVLLNPLIPYQAKQSSLRKVKTDAVDAFRLGQLFYKEELEPFSVVQSFPIPKTFQLRKVSLVYPTYCITSRKEIPQRHLTSY